MLLMTKQLSRNNTELKKDLDSDYFFPLTSCLILGKAFNLSLPLPENTVIPSNVQIVVIPSHTVLLCQFLKYTLMKLQLCPLPDGNDLIDYYNVLFL